MERNGKRFVTQILWWRNSKIHQEVGMENQTLQIVNLICLSFIKYHMNTSARFVGIFLIIFPRFFSSSNPTNQPWIPCFFPHGEDTVDSLEISWKPNGYDLEIHLWCPRFSKKTALKAGLLKSAWRLIFHDMFWCFTLGIFHFSLWECSNFREW